MVKHGEWRTRVRMTSQASSQGGLAILVRPLHRAAKDDSIVGSNSTTMYPMADDLTNTIL
jgi:hypothetical protein